MEESHSHMIFITVKSTSKLSFVETFLLMTWFCSFWLMVPSSKSDCWIYIWIIFDHAPDIHYKKKTVLPGGFISISHTSNCWWPWYDSLVSHQVLSYQRMAQTKCVPLLSHFYFLTITLSKAAIILILISEKSPQVPQTSTQTIFSSVIVSFKSLLLNLFMKSCNHSIKKEIFICYESLIY